MNDLTQKMGSSFRWVIQPLLVFGVLIVGFFGAKGLSSRDGAPPSFEKRIYAPLVSAITTEQSETPVEIKATGALRASTEVDLVAQVDGRVIAIHPVFTQGGVFQPGEVLVQIERTDYELAVARSGADVSSAETTLQSLTAEAQAARQEWRSLNGDEPVPPLVAKEPQLIEARARVAAAKAALRGAELDLERTSLSLPWPGRVVDTRVNVGGVVTRNQSLGSVFSTAGYEMAVPLRQEQLHWVHLPLERRGLEEAESSSEPTPITAMLVWPETGQERLEIEGLGPMKQTMMAVEDLRKMRTHASAGVAYVEVTPTGEFDAAHMIDRVQEALDAILDFPPHPSATLHTYFGHAPSAVQVQVQVAGHTLELPGHAVRIESELDSMSRFASLVVQIDTSLVPEHLATRLLPGLFAEVIIQGNAVRHVTSIPRSALRSNSVVWELKDNRIVFTTVESVYLDQDSIWVRGLADGARIVTSDLEVVTDGMQVRTPEDRVLEAPTQAAPKASERAQQ